jgi:hypothetical protein
VWLLDALLQFQSFMLGHGFAAMLRATAAGNPAVIAVPITWSAGVIGQHPVAADELFATTQLLIGLGIAWRPTLRAALAASVAWSVAIWWLGEGLGGLLAGTASPVSGAPGPALLYAVLAVLLWPRGTTPRNPPRIWPEGLNPSAGTRRLSAPAVRLVWLLLWGGLSVLALRPATSAPRALSTMVAAAAAGQPRWLAGADHRVALALAGRGFAAAVALSVLLGVIAVGVYLPRRVLPAILVLAMLTAGALWLAQGLGGILTGMGIDPASGPLLALLALTYWPRQAPPDVQGPPDVQRPPDVVAKALPCSAAAGALPAPAGSQP